MNADQRKFLVERVNKTFNQQVSNLKEKITKEPSLNNYLVAACLDDSIQLNDVETIKKRIKERVLALGASDALIKEDHDYRRDSYKKTVTLSASDIFIMPEAYEKALAEYNSKKADIQKEIDSLEASKDTILLKIQIGSNQVLDKLITQVDNLADLNIMNSQFLLA